MQDIVLMASLAGWANFLPPPERGWNQGQKLQHLERWKPVLVVRQKLVSNFRPREGEIDVFLHWVTGERLAFPSCDIEKILTDEEIELLDEDDPVLEVLENGWLLALNTVKLQLSVAD